MSSKTTLDIRPAPYVGQSVNVQGVPCRISAVHPAGTIDATAANGRTWRLTGLAFSSRSVPGNRWFLLTPPGMLRHFTPDERRRLRTPQPVELLFTELETRLLFVRDASGNTFPTSPQNVRQFATLSHALRRAIVEEQTPDQEAPCNA